jgi:hypothetical protein
MKNETTGPNPFGISGSLRDPLCSPKEYPLLCWSKIKRGKKKSIIMERTQISNIFG